MKRLIAAALVAALLPALAPSGAAQAATSIRLAKIGTKTAPYHKTVTIRAAVVKHGNVEVVSTRVREQGHAYHPSIRLAPGRHRITQKVTYRAFERVASSKVLHRAGSTFGDSNQETIDECWPETIDDATGAMTVECALHDERYPQIRFTQVMTGTYDEAAGTITLSNGDVVPATDPKVKDDLFIDRMTLTADLSVPTTTRKYGRTRSKTRLQTLVVREAAKPRTCATYADFKRVRTDFDHPENGDSRSTVASKLHSGGRQTDVIDTGDSVLTNRVYRTCDKEAYLNVSFEDGRAFDKIYFG